MCRPRQVLLVGATEIAFSTVASAHNRHTPCPPAAASSSGRQNVTLPDGTLLDLRPETVPRTDRDSPRLTRATATCRVRSSLNPPQPDKPPFGRLFSSSISRAAATPPLLAPPQKDW